MVTEIQYTNIRRVLDDLTEHPMMRDTTLEQVVKHTMRFISLYSFPKFYTDKIEDVRIKEYRGMLPCDLIKIDQVKDMDTNICLRAMTDSFIPGLINTPTPPQPHTPYIPELRRYQGEPSFKTQGRIIFTSFPDGKVQIAYKAIAVDEDGFPLLIDNETYLNALEAYIKLKVFTVKFDTGKITSGVLQNAKQEYGLAAANLQVEFTTPSVSEAEAISRYVTSLIPRVREFDKGFRDMGSREYLKKH